MNNRGPASQAVNIGAFLLGAVMMAGGLIFLCASSDKPSRLPIALAMLVIGGGLAGWAGFRWRQARALSPEVLDDRIVALADRQDAEVTLAEVVSGLAVPDEAARLALARLEANGLCHPEQREGRTIYVFPGLKESKVVRRCAYCGNEYSVREPLHKCPNCGGTLEIVKK
ncbi:MAG: hypothetical protein P8129_06865 [Anaerolineae bacterium]|jgi:hypothetical protein